MSKPDDSDLTDAEKAHYQRVAIATQLRWIAGQLDSGTVTAFAISWDGNEQILEGHCVTNVTRSLEIVIDEQRAARKARAAVAPNAEADASAPVGKN